MGFVGDVAVGAPPPQPHNPDLGLRGSLATSASLASHASLRDAWDARDARWGLLDPNLLNGLCRRRLIFIYELKQPHDPRILNRSGHVTLLLGC